MAVWTALCIPTRFRVASRLADARSVFCKACSAWLACPATVPRARVPAVPTSFRSAAVFRADWSSSRTCSAADSAARAVRDSPSAAAVLLSALVASDPEEPRSSRSRCASANTFWKEGSRWARTFITTGISAILAPPQRRPRAAFRRSNSSS